MNALARRRSVYIVRHECETCGEVRVHADWCPVDRHARIAVRRYVEVEALCEWLRGDEGERLRIDADRDEVASEDMFAHVIEQGGVTREDPS